MLYATSPLGDYSHAFGDTRVWETSAQAAITIAMPLGGRDALDEQLQSLCRLSYPKAGACLRSDSNNCFETTVTLLGLQEDQCLLVIEPEQQSVIEVVDHVQLALKTTAYLTEQSDTMAVLNIEGTLATPALERLCMLDLSLFDENKVARTSMEHLSVIIEKPGAAHFRLYAPRSSAQNFLHIITTALSSVSHD